jgi:hypothetical protein
VDRKKSRRSWRLRPAGCELGNSCKGSTVMGAAFLFDAPVGVRRSLEIGSQD